MTQTYSKKFKQQAVAKFINRGSKTALEVSNELNTSIKNLYRWRLQLNGSVNMKKKNEKLIRSSEDKLKILIETSNLTENELGEYIRKNGIHSSDLKLWKKECLNNFKLSGRPKKDPEIFELRKEKKDLEKDLKRKNKALAEMSARIVLLKKSHLIFGENEDDE